METLLYNSVNYFVELIKLHITVVIFFRYTYKKNTIRVFIEILTYLLFLVLSNTPFLVKGIDITHLIGIMAICSVILSIEGKNKLITVILAYFIICLVDMVSGSIILLFYKSNITHLLQNELIICIGNAFSILFLALILLLLKKCKLNKYKNGMSLKVKYLLCILLGVIGLGLYIAPLQLFYHYRGNQHINRFFILGISLTGIAFLVICLLLILAIDSRRHYIEMFNMNNRLLDMQKKYYITLLERVDNVKKFRHDVNNHISCLLHLCEKNDFERVQDYLVEMQGSVSKFQTSIQTGNDVVNAIVNDILSKNIDIKMNWRGVLPNNINMSSMDLCVIFSNLITNAFEAIEQFDNYVDKSVDVEVKTINNALVIRVINPVNHNINFIDNHLVTTKKHKELHGYGSVNVEETVNKYKGRIKYDCSNCIFIAEAIVQEVF